MSHPKCCVSVFIKLCFLKLSKVDFEDLVGSALNNTMFSYKMGFWKGADNWPTLLESTVAKWCSCPLLGPSWRKI